MSEKIRLPEPDEILSELPADEQLTGQIHGFRDEIKEILDGRSQRLIMIAGPCSAWPSEAVLEFADMLRPIADEVRDKILIVMRGYIQKPRTALGWPGPLVQPDPYEKPDIARGIRYCRKMLLEVNKMGLPVADEMLFTHNGGYFDDILSYLAVGARSAEDSEHRYIASSLDIPVGIKNPTSGNHRVGINSIVAARSGHTFAHNGYQITSNGNPHAHLILRGGERGANYSTASLEESIGIMEKAGLNNPSVVVDASHDNCKDPESGKKDPKRQITVVKSTLDSMEESEPVSSNFKGWMIEAFLGEGSQNAEKLARDQLEYGVSITDPCIDIHAMAQLAYSTHDRLHLMKKKVA
jgi:3-deoxy-7-phosphoheptulonate synthase